ncbi:PstC family ABC transporter permease [Shewanella sp. GXUN23E]|uniref:PstC family ABC transporter permease n=1 Tax=Shewanella sp. GXUN23E TaxID=3422498 RepID=UPI003D7DF8F0
MTTSATGERILWLLAASVLLMVILLFAFQVWFALPVFFNPQASVLTLQWLPEQGQYGILPMLAGSLIIGLLALFIAFPIALGVCGFCLFPRYQAGARLIRRLVRLMTGIPTVVYGLAAIFLLVPLIRETFRSGSGFSLLAATLMIVLLILPVMIMTLDNHCRPLMTQYRMVAASMGFNHAQTLRYLVLPGARRAMTSAALLGFGRAIGDTLLPMMLAGNAPQLPANGLESIRTLTAHIGLVLATENGSAMYNSLFAAGLLLLTISVTVTLAVRRLSIPAGAAAKERQS